jgi:hypothetical protein
VIETIHEESRGILGSARRFAALFDAIRELDGATIGTDECSAGRVLWSVPHDSSIREFLHCALVTRCYAVFESCVRKSIFHWLDVLPRTVGSYADLGADFALAHRRRTGQLMCELHKQRYSHLQTASVLADYLDAIGGKVPFRVTPDVFFIEGHNLCKPQLEQVYSSVRLANVWHWVESHEAVRSFVNDVRGNQNSAEAELRMIVGYRNEAAHGAVDEILASGPLVEAIEFVSCLCEALCEFVSWHCIRAQTEAGRIVKSGVVTEEYSRNIVVAKLSQCHIEVGMCATVFSSSQCYPARVLSLQCDDVDVSKKTITHECEVGIGFDRRVRRNADIYLL